MTGFRAGEVTQDHEPRHVHGLIGSGKVVINLRADRTVTIADRKDAVINVNRNEVKKVLTQAARHFDRLVAEWEKMHR